MDILELVHEDRSAVARLYACAEDECYKSFARRSDLVRHMRIHSNDRPFACHFAGCTRDFIQRSALTVHIRVHTGERPHKCEYDGCDKAFSDSSSLARHRRIHTGKRPYKCPVLSCRKDFCRKTTLTKHIKRNHPGSPSLSQDSYGGHTPRFEYSGSATGNSTDPSTPSDGYRGSPLHDGPYYPPHKHQHLSHTPQVHASTYYPAPQSQGPHFKGHGSPGSWSAPGHLENQSHRELRELREHFYRRDLSEAAYTTHPPQHPRHMRERTVEDHPGECTCDNPPPAFYEHPSSHEAFPPMVLRAPSPTPQFTYQAAPPSTRPPFSAAFSSSSTHHFAAPYSSTMPHQEFSPFTNEAPSSPILHHRRASSTSALDFPSHGSSGLGISVDERQRQYSADVGGYGDEGGYGGPSEVQYGRRPFMSGPSGGWAPRALFSSYVTQHIERMQDGDVVGAEYA